MLNKSTRKNKNQYSKNTENVEETGLSQSEKIDDIKLDSEYISNTEETETKDDDGSINPKNDSDEK